jgi:hypothetical protein
MEGNYLIHPIADLSIRDRGVKSRYGSSSEWFEFYDFNYGEYEITGFTIEFQKIDSDSITKLTDNPFWYKQQYLKRLQIRPKSNHGVHHSWYGYKDGKDRY